MSPHDGHVGYRAWVGGSGVGGNYKPRGEGGNGKHEGPMRHALVGEDLEQLVHHLLCFSGPNIVGNSYACVCENAPPRVDSGDSIHSFR